ncbi:MAG: carbonic anhydrase [Nitrospirota bacterium]
MKRFRGLLVVFLVLLLSGFVYAGEGKGDEALQKLMDGNKRYADGSLAKKDVGQTRRTELSTKGQKPFAIVVACSDSRVPPEILFDQGLGDIFVIRVAGNVVDPIALGSIEYGAEHLHSPLLFILGHTKCGAVTATLEATGKAEGNIGAIVKEIMPAAKTAKKKGGTKEEMLETAIHENVKNVYKDIMKSSPIIAHLAEKGELKIVGGEYDITTGKVAMIDLPAEKESKKKAH